MDLKSFGGDVEGEVEVQRGSLRQGVSSPAMGRARLVKGTGLLTVHVIPTVQEPKLTRLAQRHAGLNMQIQVPPKQKGFIDDTPLDRHGPWLVG